MRGAGLQKAKAVAVAAAQLATARRATAIQRRASRGPGVQLPDARSMQSVVGSDPGADAAQTAAPIS
jgi:hypothetical protein